MADTVATITTNPYAEEFAFQRKQRKFRIFSAIVIAGIAFFGGGFLVGALIFKERPLSEYNFRLDGRSNELLKTNGVSYSLDGDKVNKFCRDNFSFKSILDGVLDEKQIGDWINDNKFPFYASSVFFEGADDFLYYLNNHKSTFFQFRAVYEANAYHFVRTIGYRDNDSNEITTVKKTDILNPRFGSYGWITNREDSNTTTVNGAFGYDTLNDSYEEYTNGVSTLYNSGGKKILNTAAPFDSSITLSSPYVSSGVTFAARDSFIFLLSDDGMLIRNDFSYFRFNNNVWEDKLDMFTYLGKSKRLSSYISNLNVVPGENPIAPISNFTASVVIGTNAIIDGRVWNEVKSSFNSDSKTFFETVAYPNVPSSISPIDYPYCVQVSNQSGSYILYLERKLVVLDYTVSANYFSIVIQPDLRITSDIVIDVTPNQTYTAPNFTAAVDVYPVSDVHWTLDAPLNGVTLTAGGQLSVKPPFTTTAGTYSIAITASKAPNYRPVSATISVVVAAI